MKTDITGLGSLADLAMNLVNRFFPQSASESEKLAAAVQIQQALENRESAVLDLQKSVMAAEVAQGDTYTKRARPTIVYFGLVAIGLVHVCLPIIAWIVLLATSKPITNMPTIALPEQFWLTWGGVCGIWIVGRSLERSTQMKGMVGGIAGMITGSAPSK